MVGVIGVLTLAVSGEVRAEGAEELLVTLCRREDKAVSKTNTENVGKNQLFKKKRKKKDFPIKKKHLMCLTWCVGFRQSTEYPLRGDVNT